MNLPAPEEAPKQPRPAGAALRRGLPFGAVMATAGASVLAGRCGLHALAGPLLALAVVQTVWGPLAGAWRCRSEFALGWSAWWSIGPPHEHTGVHTVPLGLAVIAGGLAALAAGGATPWAWPVAWASLAAAWLLAIVCSARCVWSLASRGMTLREFDGAWFLAPAAFLGAAIATDALAGRVAGAGAAALAELALAGALLGWFGYWAVALAALARVRRYGLSGVPQAPWWIAMGCAGLAAAAFGGVVRGPGSGWALRAFLTDAMAATAIVAAMLCVPVLVCSAEYLVRRCRFRGCAAWPPTFSTAVFALGCLATGEIAQIPLFRALGLATAYVTLVFWAVTAAWNTGRVLAHVLGSDRRENGASDGT